MKSIALLAATALMSCSLALAQEQKPVAAEATKPAAVEATKPAAAEAPKPAAQETAKPAAPVAKPAAPVAKPVARAAKPAVTGTKRVRREEDARHCLGRPSNTEIIKCAEAYL